MCTFGTIPMIIICLELNQSQLKYLKLFGLVFDPTGLTMKMSVIINSVLDHVVFLNVSCCALSGGGSLPVDGPQSHSVQSLVLRAHQWALCLPGHGRLLEGNRV